jgi:hypothetical protein
MSQGDHNGPQKNFPGFPNILGTQLRFIPDSYIDPSAPAASRISLESAEALWTVDIAS